jgi:hypothetical protein
MKNKFNISYFQLYLLLHVTIIWAISAQFCIRKSTSDWCFQEQAQSLEFNLLYEPIRSVMANSWGGNIYQFTNPYV